MGANGCIIKISLFYEGVWAHNSFIYCQCYFVALTTWFDSINNVLFSCPLLILGFLDTYFQAAKLIVSSGLQSLDKYDCALLNSFSVNNIKDSYPNIIKSVRGRGFLIDKSDKLKFLWIIWSI